MTFNQILCELGSMFSVLKVCKEYHMSLKYFFPKFAQKICTKRIYYYICHWSMYKSHICQNLGQKHFKNKYHPLCIIRQIWSLILIDIKTHEISKIDYKGIFKFIGLMTIVSPKYAFRIMISFSKEVVWSNFALEAC